jgi:hypothetical protein
MVFGVEILWVWGATAKTCGERANVSDLTATTDSFNEDGGYYWSASDSCSQCVAPTTTFPHCLVKLYF